MTPWNQREAGLDPRASVDPGEPPAAEAPQEAGGRGRRAGVVWPWLVVCCYLAGAVAVTARLWVDPAGRAQAGDANDVDLFAWFVRYAATAVGHGQLPALVTSAMNAPQGVNLMWNTSFLLPGVLLAPLTLLAGPQVSLTVVLTAGFAGSAASLFWVLRRWGAGLGAAALGGAVYGFSPALVASGAGHYHLQFAVLPPLIIDAALRLLTGRSRAVRGGVWLGLLCAAQLFTGEELLVYTVVAAVILAATVAVSHPRAVPARTRGAASGLAVAVLVFLLVDGYALWVQFAGPLTEHSKLGGSLTGNLSWFVTPSAALWFHTTASAAEAASQQLAAEYVSYLGWPLIGMLVVCAVVFWRDVRVRAAAVTCAVLELCALGGGSLRVGGGVTWPGRLLPWHWLQGLPGLAQVLPWRFSILADGAAAAVLAFALDRAWTAVSRARDGGGQPDWPGWAGWWPRAAFTAVACSPCCRWCRGLHSPGPAGPGRLGRDLQQAATPSGRAGAHRPVPVPEASSGAALAGGDRPAAGDDRRLLHRARREGAGRVPLGDRGPADGFRRLPERALSGTPPAKPIWCGGPRRHGLLAALSGRRGHRPAVTGRTRADPAVRQAGLSHRRGAQLAAAPLSSVT